MSVFPTCKGDYKPTSECSVSASYWQDDYGQRAIVVREIPAVQKTIASETARWVPRSGFFGQFYSRRSSNRRCEPSLKAYGRVKPNLVIFPIIAERTGSLHNFFIWIDNKESTAAVGGRPYRYRGHPKSA